MVAENFTIFYDRDRWLRVLEEIAIALGKVGDPVEICLIGSAACIFGGMEGRTSIDLDVWNPNSSFDELELKHAVIKSGLLFDPKSEREPDTPYLQIVEPGIVQTGDFTSIPVKRMGRLHVTRPPYENIIASKLTRANLKDIQDIQFLMQAYRPEKSAIEKVIQTLPPSPREAATENLIYLEILK
ncbi:MAG: hypothetical protein H7Y36_12035 [Armatimonadetes bacterium]|nr:hypothetical protein [Akkermansiaceae bacterium]